LRKTVISLAEMSDDRLWRTLRILTSGMGMELSERKRYRINYDALRYTLNRITEEDIARINEITEMYQSFGKGGGRR